MITLRCLISLAAVGLLCGCSTSESRLLADAKKSPAAKETIEAGDFLVALHEQSKLPGDTKDMHGRVESVIPLSEIQSGQEVFPISRTFHVAITGELFTNNYTVIKQSKGSAWQLQRAWRIGSDGRITEWAVK